MKSPAGAAAHPLAQIHSNTGMRGVAALTVVVYHLQLASFRFPIPAVARIFDHGYLMVDLFFILSGFILSYASGGGRFTEAVGYKRFLISRMIRIYPLHIFCLSYLVILAGLGDAALNLAGHGPVFGDWSPDSLELLFAQATLINGWFYTASGWNTPTWSISVELIAYAVFPFILIWLSRSLLTTLLLSVAILAFYTVIAATSGSLDIIGRIAILRCLAGFGIGMILFRYRHRLTLPSDGLASLIQIACLIWIVATLYSHGNDVLIMPALLGLVASTMDDRGVVGRLTETRILQFLGEISYSIYLNHVCLLILLTPFWGTMQKRSEQFLHLPKAAYIPLFILCVIVASVLTHRLVEQPARKWLSSRLNARAGPRTEAPSAP